MGSTAKPPQPLSRALADLAHRTGERALEEARAMAGARAALGPRLAGRLQGVERAGERWTLVIAGDAEAEALRRLTAEILAALRVHASPRAPRSLAIRAVRSSGPPARSARLASAAAPPPPHEPSPSALAALARIPQDAVRQKLRRFLEARTARTS